MPAPGCSADWRNGARLSRRFAAIALAGLRRDQESGCNVDWRNQARRNQGRRSRRFAAIAIARSTVDSGETKSRYLLSKVPKGSEYPTASSGSSLQFLLAQTGVALNRAKWTKPIEGAQWSAEHVDDACERALLQQWLDDLSAPAFCGSGGREAPQVQLSTTRGNFVKACILELVAQEQDSLELDRIRPASMFTVFCALHDDMNNVRQNGVRIE